MKLFKLFFRYVKKHWILLILTILIVIALNYVRSIVPKLTSVFIAIVDKNTVEGSELPSFFLTFFDNASSKESKLLITSIIILIVAFVREIINIICDVNVYKISELVGCKAQTAYFEKVQDLPYSYLNHAETGDLIQRSTQDINRFKQFISGSFLELFNSLCKVIIYGVSMF